MIKEFGSEFIFLFEGVTIFLLCLVAYFSYEHFIRHRMLVRVRLDAVLKDERSKVDLSEILDRRGLNANGQLKYPFLRSLNELLLRSGQTLSIAQLAALFFGTLSLMLMAGLYIGLDFILSVSIAILSGLFAIYIILKITAKRRIDKFSGQLPDAIDMIARSLRVGNPLPVTIRMVAREMQDPIGVEFLITSNELSAGRDLPHAIKNLQLRVGQDDLSVLSSAIAIQAETGGNLVEILSLLSKVMRARVKLRRRIDAVSAEGRISGRVLSALPFVMFVAFNVFTPSYYERAWEDPSTKYILGACVVWTLIGNFVISRMVNMKI